MEKEHMEKEQYEHYIGLDWAQTNMAAAVLSTGIAKAKYLEDKPDIEKLKKFIKSFRGTKMLVIEETTSTQWLFSALLETVDKLVVCDPYRNKLMTHGAKNDKIDSLKLAQLGVRGDMNVVYHSTAGIMNLRKLVSGYDDIVRAIVRAKNQMSAVYRGECKSYQKKEKLCFEENIFVESLKEKEIKLL
jgi:transposase